MSCLRMRKRGCYSLESGADELEKVFANDQVQVNLKSVEGPGNIYLRAR